MPLVWQFHALHEVKHGLVPRLTFKKIKNVNQRFMNRNSKSLFSFWICFYFNLLEFLRRMEPITHLYSKIKKKLKCLAALHSAPKNRPIKESAVGPGLERNISCPNFTSEYWKDIFDFSWFICVSIMSLTQHQSKVVELTLKAVSFDEFHALGLRVLCPSPDVLVFFSAAQQLHTIFARVNL